LNAGLSNVYGYDFPHCKFIYVAAQTNFWIIFYDYSTKLTSLIW
jgi:hypothetical protein